VPRLPCPDTAYSRSSPSREHICRSHHKANIRTSAYCAHIWRFPPHSLQCGMCRPCSYWLPPQSLHIFLSLPYSHLAPLPGAARLHGRFAHVSKTHDSCSRLPLRSLAGSPATGRLTAASGGKPAAAARLGLRAPVGSAPSLSSSSRRSEHGAVHTHVAAGSAAPRHSSESSPRHLLVTLKP
jgi:hypothetical protein